MRVTVFSGTLLSLRILVAQRPTCTVGDGNFDPRGSTQDFPLRMSLSKKWTNRALSCFRGGSLELELRIRLCHCLLLHLHCSEEV